KSCDYYQKPFPQVTLEYPEVYIESGTSNYGLPMNQLTNDKGLVWGARKTAGFTGGTVGVIVYHLKDRRVRANQALYERMYHDLPHEGDNNIHRGILNSDLLYSGSMGNSGTPTIEIEILNYRTISTASSSAYVSEKKEPIPTNPSTTTTSAKPKITTETTNRLSQEMKVIIGTISGIACVAILSTIGIIKQIQVKEQNVPTHDEVAAFETYLSIDLGAPLVLKLKFLVRKTVSSSPSAGYDDVV
ncbi:17591_t:CDS:2, partial [Funneliformis caledonium]